MQFSSKVALSLIFLSGVLAAPVPLHASVDLADLNTREPAPLVWMNIEKHSIDDDSYERAHRQHIMGHDEWLHHREDETEDSSLFARDMDDIVELDAREPHWMNIERHELREENHLSKRKQHIMNIAGHDDWLDESMEGSELHKREPVPEAREFNHHLFRIGVVVNPNSQFDFKPDHTHFA